MLKHQLDVKVGTRVQLLRDCYDMGKKGDVFTVLKREEVQNGYVLTGGGQWGLYKEIWTIEDPITPDEAAKAVDLPDVEDVRDFFK